MQVMPYDSRKTAQTVAFFILKSSDLALDALKAAKLMYLAGHVSLAGHGFPIQTEKRVSMPCGSVNSQTYDLLLGKGSAGEKAL